MSFPKGWFTILEWDKNEYIVFSHPLRAAIHKALMFLQMVRTNQDSSIKRYEYGSNIILYNKIWKYEGQKYYDICQIWCQWISWFFFFFLVGQTINIWYNSPFSMSHAPFLDDLMAVPTISLWIQMVCVMIKAFCEGYSTLADGDAFATPSRLKLKWFIQRKCTDMNSATSFCAGLVRMAETLSFKSTNSSKQLLTIKGNK